MKEGNTTGESVAKNGKVDVKKMSDRELLELLPQLVNRLDSYEKEVTSLKIRVEDHESEIVALKEKLEAKEEENKLLASVNEQFADELKELQQRSRHINVVIRGIKEERKENVWELVESVGRKIGIENPDKDIQICHRVPTRSSNGPRPIVVRLLNSKTRDKWIKEYKQKQLWKQHLYVSEHLTPYNQNLFYHTRKLAKEKKFKYAWTKDCQIYLKKNETSKLYIIKHMRDLDMVSSNLQRSSLEEEEEDSFFVQK
uniref:FP protein C-terminal domain-containing protein n=1 Tax=Cacopsylla melanoneura TaxID=428564 RepID=A0A8D9E7W1_9HEMI